MKTKVMKSVLAVLVFATSAKAVADENVQVKAGQEPPPWSVLAQNRVSNGKSVWVTMYNMFDSVREARCVRDGDETLFSGYYPPLKYYIRAEVKENVDCGGRTISDFRDEVDLYRGAYAKVLSYNDGGRTGYMWRISMGPNAQPPVKQAIPQVTQETYEQAEQMGLKVKGGSTLEAHNGLSNGKSVWVTIYNFFGSNRDHGCVQPGQRQGWDNYYDMGLAYSMRFEVKNGANCSGDTIYDSGIGISDIHGTKGGRITNINEGGKEKYIIAPYEG